MAVSGVLKLGFGNCFWKLARQSLKLANFNLFQLRLMNENCSAKVENFENICTRFLVLKGSIYGTTERKLSSTLDSRFSVTHAYLVWHYQSFRGRVKSLFPWRAKRSLDETLHKPRVSTRISFSGSGHVTSRCWLAGNETIFAAKQSKSPGISC